MSAANDPAPVHFSTPHSLLPGERPLLHREFLHLRSHWWWFLLLGVLLVLCGTVAVVVPPIATAAAIDVLAILFLIAGVATVVSSFWAGRWSGALVHVLIGILYIAVGLAMTEKPLRATEVLTMFIAVLFMVGGAFRIFAALSIRHPQWGWALLNGIVTLLLGIYIFRHYPISALWVPGLLVGMEMLLSGWTWIMLALAIRAIPVEPSK
jgi:uncharacterized membrane protein HdeD (DUF308 family)